MTNPTIPNRALAELMKPLNADASAPGPTPDKQSVRDRGEEILESAFAPHLAVVATMNRTFREAAGTISQDLGLNDAGKRSRLDAVGQERDKAGLALLTAERKTGIEVSTRYRKESVIATPRVHTEQGARMVQLLLMLTPEMDAPGFIRLLLRWGTGREQEGDVGVQVVSFLVKLASGFARRPQYQKYVQQLRDAVETVMRHYDDEPALLGRYLRNRAERIHDAFGFVVNRFMAAPLEITTLARSQGGYEESGLVTATEMNVLQRAIEAPLDFAGFMVPDEAEFRELTVAEILVDLGA